MNVGACVNMTCFLDVCVLLAAWWYVLIALSVYVMAACLLLVEKYDDTVIKNCMAE